MLLLKINFEKQTEVLRDDVAWTRVAATETENRPVRLIRLQSLLTADSDSFLDT